MNKYFLVRAKLVNELINQENLTKENAEKCVTEILTSVKNIKNKKKLKEQIYKIISKFK